MESSRNQAQQNLNFIIAGLLVFAIVFSARLFSESVSYLGKVLEVGMTGKPATAIASEMGKVTALVEKVLPKVAPSINYVGNSKFVFSCSETNTGFLSVCVWVTWLWIKYSIVSFVCSNNMYIIAMMI
jgi:hypothetical protein